MTSGIPSRRGVRRDCGNLIYERALTSQRAIDLIHKTSRLVNAAAGWPCVDAPHRASKVTARGPHDRSPRDDRLASTQWRKHRRRWRANWHPHHRSIVGSI